MSSEEIRGGKRRHCTLSPPYSMLKTGGWGGVINVTYRAVGLRKVQNLGGGGGYSLFNCWGGRGGGFKKKYKFYRGSIRRWNGGGGY